MKKVSTPVPKSDIQDRTSSAYSRLQRHSPEQNDDGGKPTDHQIAQCPSLFEMAADDLLHLPLPTVLFLSLKRTSRCTASFCNTTRISERSHSRAYSAVVRRVQREAWCSQLRICANVALHRNQGDNDADHVGKPHRKAISAQSPQMFDDHGSESHRALCLGTRQPATNGGKRTTGPRDRIRNHIVATCALRVPSVVALWPSSGEP